MRGGMRVGMRTLYCGDWDVEPRVAEVSRLCAAVGKRAVPFVVEEMNGRAKVQLEITISNRPLLSKSSTITPPPREDCVEFHTRCYVGNPAIVFGGCKSRGRQQVLFACTCRIFAQRHIGKVHQPSGLEIVKPQREQCGEVLDGFLRRRPFGVTEFGRNRKEAALRGSSAGEMRHA